jgi:hypothetical protein
MRAWRNLADAPDPKPGERKLMGARLPPPAPPLARSSSVWKSGAPIRRVLRRFEPGLRDLVLEHDVDLLARRGVEEWYLGALMRLRCGFKSRPRYRQPGMSLVARHVSQGVAQMGERLPWAQEVRWFESGHPDSDRSYARPYRLLG